MKAVFLLFALVAVSANRELFQQFKTEYSRNYATTQEEEYRFGVFMENLKIAQILQKEDSSAEYGVTKFMDLTPEEFKATFLGFRPKLRDTPVEVSEPAASAVACSSTTDCNYAQLGATTPVKDQGQCGSCWAFSATQATETAWFQAGHPLPVLGPQQIVDCDKTDAGCNGGDTPTAYEYLIGAGGQETEANYPYQGVDGTCKFSSSKVAASIYQYNWGITPCNTFATHNCDSQNETGLWSVVQKTGPMSICVDAQPWQVYRNGIFNSTSCKHGYYNLDHCVHLTGYGTENGVKYWTVKNSWGTGWGEQGYIRLAFGYNVCGVADEVTYALAK